MVDDMLAHAATVRDRPVWQPMPESVRGSFSDSPPREGSGPEAAYAEFVENVLAYSNGNTHPRFFGWVQGNGTLLGMMADMLAAGMNPHMAGFDQAPQLVEEQVVSWMSELLGMKGGSGVLVTGGSMANTLGLVVARFTNARKAGIDVREDGLQQWKVNPAHGPLVFYGSAETHGWARKAAELMGLGNRAFRRISVDSHYRLNIRELMAAIARDMHEGSVPFCVIGTAGTVNTGASDDLHAIADVCMEQGLWFHVDGAFGALAFLSDELRPQVAGMERADSLAFDLHKWGYLPFECACVLVRDPAVHRETFAAPASYLAAATRGVIAGGLPFADRGVDLTRGFKALKVWLSIRSHGVDRLTRLIEQNVRQTQYLVSLVESSADLEMMAAAPLNIACFRYAPADLDESRRNAVNEEVLLRLQESGIAVPSSTRLDGKFALRCANVNHRTRHSDIDMMVEAIVRIGNEVTSGTT
ncbi:MAG: pyridoxal-dependent decarboxylase [Gemmatimonadaceae bacterium]